MKKCPDCAELVQEDARVCRFCRHEFAPLISSIPNAHADAPRALSGTNVRKAENPKQKERQGWGCLAAMIIGMVLLVAALASDPDASSNDTAEVENESNASSPAKQAAVKGNEPESPYADVGRQIAWVSAGKDSIKEQLKDPDSAQWRNVHFYSGGGTPVVCGEVNARNGFGGYTGFERFVAAGSVIAATESQVKGGLGPVWSKFCVKAPHDEI